MDAVVGELIAGGQKCNCSHIVDLFFLGNSFKYCINYFVSFMAHKLHSTYISFMMHLSFILKNSFNAFSFDRWHHKHRQSLVSDQGLALQSSIDSPPQAFTENLEQSPLFEHMAFFSFK